MSYPVRVACCRVEYDAYRVDLEWAGQQGGDTGLLAEARRQHDLRLAEYQRLREKVTVKLTLLDENRVRMPCFYCFPCTPLCRLCGRLDDLISEPTRAAGATVTAGTVILIGLPRMAR